MKQEPLVFSSAVLCPNCGYFRSEDEDNCRTCETKEMLIDQIISEKQRIAPNGMSPMDWQALDKEEFDFFLDKAVVPELERIIATPLSELGQIASYWTGCHCNRQKCESCWMKKNLWEVK